MLGLMILLAVSTYMTIWAGVVILSYRLTFKVTASKKKSYFVSTVFFLIMYLIPFWDLIPTLVMHKYYCTTQAGFFVYKTPEEWEQENPGVLETLEPFKDTVYVDTPVGRAAQSNGRFGSIVKSEVVSLFPIRKSSLVIVDISNQQKIFEKINFSRGYGQLAIGKEGSWKFWLYSSSCFSYDEGRSIGRVSESVARKLKME